MKQLTLEQRSQIFALLQRKNLRKEIVRIVDISKSTLNRELKRNSSDSGSYICFKAHQKTIERRRHATANARLCPEFVWRIREHILEEQSSPRQIADALSQEGIHVSH